MLTAVLYLAAMATMLETPSRIWRRIEAIENNDMPSLPSLPLFEDSAEADDSHEPTRNDDDHQFDEDFEGLTSPLHSTPTTTHHTVNSVNGPSSTSSTARFAHSIASRSNKSLTGLASSRGMSTRRSQHESFEVPSLPQISSAAAAHRYRTDDEDEQEESKSVPDVYLPPPDDEDDQDREFSLTDALQSLSRSSSPPFIPETISREETPKKNYDFSMSLKSEPKVCH